MQRHMTLVDLEIDPLFLVVSKLAPREMAFLAAVNRQLYSMMKKEKIMELWKRKFAHHFPYHYEMVKSKKGIDWKQEFAKAYKADYKKLSSSKKKVFNWVKEGNVEALKSLTVAQPFDYLFKVYDAQNNSPFIYALQGGNQQILDYCFALAIQKSKNQNIDKILNHKTQSQLVDYAFSCRQSLEVIMAVLLRRFSLGSKNAHYQTPLMLAAEFGRLDIVNELLSRDITLTLQPLFSGVSPLNYAVRDNHIHIVQRLLAAKMDVNGWEIRGFSPLTEAVKFGFLNMAITLIEHGAHVVNAIPFYSPLTYAVNRGNQAMVELLLAHGATDNLPANHLSALLASAAEYGHRDVANVLLAKGAIIDSFVTARHLLAINANVWDVSPFDAHTSELLIRSQTQYFTILLNAQSGTQYTNEHCTAEELNDTKNPLKDAVRKRHREVFEAKEPSGAGGQPEANKSIKPSSQGMFSPQTTSRITGEKRLKLLAFTPLQSL